MSEEIYNNEASQDEVSAELDAMVCDLIDDMLNGLADGEDLGVVLIAEDANGNRYQACFTEDGPEACLEGAQHFIEANAAGIQSDHVGRSIDIRLRMQAEWSSTASSRMPSL